MGDFLLDWATADDDGTTTLSDGTNSVDVTVSTPTNSDGDGATAVGEVSTFGASALQPSSGVTSPVTTTISFDQPVENLSFEIFDLDSDGCKWDDKVTVIARDADGNIVPVTFSDTAASHEVSGNSIEGEGQEGWGIAGPGDGDTVTVTIAGPIVSLELVYEDGDDASHSGTIGYSDMSFDLSCDPDGPYGPDGIVEGSSGDDLIDAAYTGDPDGDMIDAGDALLPGEAPDDDIVLAGAGNDTVQSGLGDDEVYGGSGHDVIDGGAGDDYIVGDGPDVGSDECDDDFETSTKDISNVVFYYDTDGDGLYDHTVKVDNFPDSDGGTFISNDLDDFYPQLRDFVTASDPSLAGLEPVLGVSVKAGTESTFYAVEGDGNGPLPDDGPTMNTGATDLVLEYSEFYGSYDGDHHDDDHHHDDHHHDDDHDHHDDDACPPGGGYDDTLSGGMGNDTIIGAGGSDVVYGGEGDDVIDAGAAIPLPDRGYPGLFPADADPFDDRDTVSGGDGNDIISTGDDNDLIDGGAGNDVINAGVDDDTVSGGEGDDLIIASEGSDEVDGGAGNDTIYGGLGPAFPDSLNIRDDQGDLVPDNGMDTIHGGAGDDVIFGEDDDDTLYGDGGNDAIDAGIDDDTVFGGAGNDTITGGQGADSLSGGDDRDVFLGGNQGDFVDGGSGGDDYDTLDLTGAAEAQNPGGSLNIVYDSDPEDGTVYFRDGDGNVTGTMRFEEIENVIPCFTPGTMIATPTGERPVESLREGDKIITRDNGIQEIRWIGQRPLNGLDLARAPHLKPILVKKGALGNGLPERDMLVSPNHRLLVANDRTALYFEEHEVLAAAKHLVNNRGISVLNAPGTTYVHFMFDRHEVVLSNGAWTESFQPGDYTLNGMGNAQRNEIYELFPELRTEAGIEGYSAARKTLKRHEAALLLH